MPYTKGTLAGDFIEGVLSEIPDAVCVSVINLSAGMSIDSYCNTPDFDPDVAAVHHTEVLRTEQKAVEALQLNDSIKDIFITLGTQIHMLTLSKTGKALYYIVADAHKTNLSMVRSTMQKFAKGI
jgi:predicted regulator of Ras-like GTPase activity (Roadblock/LC7/MglB family)